MHGLSSRRRILHGAAGAIAASVAVSAASAAPGGVSDSDAELIHLCGRIEALQRQIDKTYKTITDYARWRVAIDHLQEMQDDLVNQSGRMRASTPEGLRARAKAVVALHPELRDIEYEDDVTGLLLRDLGTFV